jgi:hypothetical protein
MGRISRIRFKLFSSTSGKLFTYVTTHIYHLVFLKIKFIFYTVIAVTLLTPKAWLDNSFSNLQTPSIQAIKSNDGNGCIIDAPEVTMANPFIGSAVSDALEDINKVLESPVNERSKALCIT